MTIKILEEISPVDIATSEWRLGKERLKASHFKKFLEEKLQKGSIGSVQTTIELNFSETVGPLVHPYI